jgi:hypothetical protein
MKPIKYPKEPLGLDAIIAWFQQEIPETITDQSNLVGGTYIPHIIANTKYFQLTINQDMIWVRAPNYIHVLPHVEMAIPVSQIAHLRHLKYPTDEIMIFD